MSNSRRTFRIAALVHLIFVKVALTIQPPIYMNTSEGVALLRSASHSLPYWNMIRYMATEFPGQCGQTTAAILLNTLASQGLPAPVSETYTPKFPGFVFPKVHYWDQVNVNSSDCAKAVSTPYSGSLNQVAGLLTCGTPQQNESSSVVVRAQAVKAEISSAAQFRESLQRSFEARPLRYVAVNFDRHGLNQEGAGHHSPVGAFDVETDRVLIMDVATYKYPPFWVSVEMIFEAMQKNYSHPEFPPAFNSSMLYTKRGFILVELLRNMTMDDTPVALPEEKQWSDVMV